MNRLCTQSSAFLALGPSTHYLAPGRTFGMYITSTAQELQSGNRRVCLAMGFFDGVHLGHQQIIRQTVSDARRHDAISLVLTFDRHPRTVLAPDCVPPLIYSLPQKIRALGAMSVETLLLLHFDHALCRQPGELFIRNLVRDLKRVQSICVGANFVFGYNRGGNVDMLKKLGQELRFVVHGIASLALDGEAVSSTRIRHCIRSGKLDLAGQMLGRAYSIAGIVTQGDRLGRTLGYPTANIETTGLALPPSGVYVVHATLSGKNYPAVLNIGYRPTLQNSQPSLRVEAHLLDFKEDIYGQELEITFLEKLRDETKFLSLDDLRLQIARDVEQSRQIFEVS
jgi:riboflavin kinase / FMN adenylyltransferase